MLDGCLCVLVQDAHFSLEMWVMKELGFVDSWTKTFSFKRAFTNPPHSFSQFAVQEMKFYLRLILNLFCMMRVKNKSTKLN